MHYPNPTWRCAACLCGAVHVARAHTITSSYRVDRVLRTDKLILMVPCHYRDYYGTGTNLAGLAAGNGLLPNDITPGMISGAAPRARVAVYKYSWGGFRTELDALDALEQVMHQATQLC